MPPAGGFFYAMYTDDNDHESIETLVDTPYLYSDYPYYHRPTEGERLTVGFTLLISDDEADPRD